MNSHSVHTVVTVFQLVTGLPTQPMVVAVGGSLLGVGVLGAVGYPPSDELPGHPVTVGAQLVTV